MSASVNDTGESSPQLTQTPIAVIGISCRLPGGCNSPEQFWKFLLDGGVADTTPPASRFSLAGHYDGSLQPWTMRSPGGMFIDIDPRDMDAGFFGLSQVDAVAMDPQQRQLLEVVYEGLENSGLTLDGINSKLFGCFVGSYASDYSDIQTRDPEDKSPSFTVGCGRAMMSNRISHFLDIKGPSMTIDTACSGSLIAVDLACRYLDSGDADGAIVAGCNLYMSPEHNMDQHAMTAAASPSGRCWTFDARADGYIKAEAVNCLVLKRLYDAVRDGDPIRAVIRGTSTNSDGWTAGIASPSSEAQALAIQRAYQRAGIARLSDTPYLECHGTGTLAGDPVECKAAASVFASDTSTLRIGSVKSNIGHSEPAAGISGMIKSILSVERGTIPGNPTFETPNPNIDFDGYNLAVSNTSVAWPAGTLQRASVNSFGYGGSNAHAIVEHPSILLSGEYTKSSVTSFCPTDQFQFMQVGNPDDDMTRNQQYVFVFSANDETSLRANIKEYICHLSNPAVKVNSDDLAYTLGRRRTHHFHRAYVVSDSLRFKESQVVHGKVQATSTSFSSAPIGLVFTGQGAQWPQMGKELLSRFPEARKTIRHLDQVLQSLPDGDRPSWRLEEELCAVRSPEHIRQPLFSQPLVTALQLALLAVVRDWGMASSMVIGHSSGEIAAAVAAGLLSPEQGIKVAYLRGKATQDTRSEERVSEREKEEKLGMLAVGLGPERVQPYIHPFPLVQIACYNSPQSVTLSGPVDCLESIHNGVKADHGFARMLVVDLAYHHPKYMKNIAQQYRKLLETHCPDLGDLKGCFGNTAEFFSSVDGAKLTSDRAPLGIDYWVNNLLCPVKFSQAMSVMMSHEADSSKTISFMLLELGPSAALAGPINQVRQSLSQDSLSFQYLATLNRSRINSTLPLYDLAGKMFLTGASGVDWFKVNSNNEQGARKRKPCIITDLPNYQWNHSIKYWHESLASHDWRYRHFPVHDLLGSKVLGTSWETPTWKRTLRLKDVPWIRDHTIGTNVVFPASAYIAMAVEAMFQTAKCSTSLLEHVQHEQGSSIGNVTQLSYQLRDVRLLRALVLQEDKSHQVYLFLTPAHGRQKHTWFHFKISSLEDKTNKTWTEHCTGLVRLHPIIAPPPPSQSSFSPLEYPTNAKLWYKSLQNVGFNFGPAFQNLSEIECIAGQWTSKARISCRPSPPPAKGTNGASQYPVHPCILDGFFQACTPSLYQGHRTMIERALVPKIINEIVIYSTPSTSSPPNPSIPVAITKSNSVDGEMLNLLVDTESVFSVAGRKDKVQNYASNAAVYDLNKPGSLVATVKGLHYTELPLPAAEITPSGPQHTPTLMTVVSRPDISLLHPEVDLHALISDYLQNDADLQTEVAGLSEGLNIPLEAGYLISLLKHKRATPSVLDMDITIAMEVDSVPEPLPAHDATPGRGDGSTCQGRDGDGNQQQPKPQQLEDLLAGFHRYLFTFSDPNRLSSSTTRYFSAKFIHTEEKDGEIGRSKSGIGGVEFRLYDPRNGQLPQPEGHSNGTIRSEKFDLVILRAGGQRALATNNDLSAALQTARGSCADQGFVLLLLHGLQERTPRILANGSNDDVVAETESNSSSNSRQMHRSDQQSSFLVLDNQLSSAGLETRVALVTPSRTCIRLCAPLRALPKLTDGNHADTTGTSMTRPTSEGVEIRVLDPSTLELSPASCSKPTSSTEPPFRHFHSLDTTGRPLQNLSKAAGFLSTSSESRLVLTTNHDEKLDNRCKVLVILDDTNKPLLPDGYKSLTPGSDSGWTDLKKLLLSSGGGRGHIIWVVFGSDSANPANGLVRGLTRSIRNENPELSISILTLESDVTANVNGHGDASHLPHVGACPVSVVDTSIASIMRLITLIAQSHGQSTLDVPDSGTHLLQETEYTERSISSSEFGNGHRILYIDRIKPRRQLQTPSITASSSHNSSPLLQETWLRRNPNIVRLHCERVGPGSGMNSLVFSEIPQSQDLVPGPGQVEISIHAAGLNFKDIATTLGLVPENEHLLGLEGAGTITKVHPGDIQNRYKVGDRVAVLSRGCFANRIIAPVENIFSIPNNLSFQEAATIPIVYFTAIYSLIEIARLPELITQRQQKKNLPPLSILIHSAAGGVGLATIQLCHHLGLTEIYTTVSTDSKRNFLTTQHNILPERIFSSRTTEFGPKIRALRARDGQGVDIVLNSLTGDLLDESWRLLAPGGVFLEIGKRDIVDGNVVDMGPFNRGCSYHGIDISREGVYDDLELNYRILQMVKGLVEEKKVKPISPVRVFGLGGTGVGDAMRYMRSGEHMGKIVISDDSGGSGEHEHEDARVLVRPLREGDIENKELVLDSEAGYLIVGGLRGLCGSLAVFMARCGARNLVVASRSGSGGMDEVSRRVIRDLESLGVDVTIVKADVTDLEAMRAVFRDSCRPIKGIVHGAMVLRDKTFEAMTEMDFHQALAPKYAGTWNLHIAASEAGHRPLDFFTMLSSISGVIGTAGQPNYAAGNCFQDAFARYRRSLGLVAQVVDLGAVDDVGYLSENQAISDRLRSRSQITSLSEKQLHHILRTSILMQRNNNDKKKEVPTQLVTGLSFPLWDKNSPLLSDRRFHSLLVPEHQQQRLDPQGNTQPGKGDGQGHRTRLFHAMIRDSKLLTKQTKRESLLNEAVKLVNGQLVRILGLSTDMEGSKPLRSYGIDSLAAVDLRNWLKVQLGAELSTLDILNGGSLDDLGGKIVDGLLKKAGAEGE